MFYNKKHKKTRTVYFNKIDYLVNENNNTFVKTYKVKKKYDSFGNYNIRVKELEDM